MPYTLAEPAHSELIIKKSRFIGCVQPMADRASAQAVVDALWKQHPGAAHICWALLAGGQSAAVDDGEPGGNVGHQSLKLLVPAVLAGVHLAVLLHHPAQVARGQCAQGDGALRHGVRHGKTQGWGCLQYRNRPPSQGAIGPCSDKNRRAP